MSKISAHEARRNFSKLLELAFYKNRRIQIERNRKPMAWLVGEPFMQAVEEMIEHIIEHQPALADTLAITLDDDIRATIDRSREEWRKGQKIPLEEIVS